MWLKVFFAPSEASQAAGRAFLRRFRQCIVDRDPEVDRDVEPAQITAIYKWGVQRAGAFDYLREITHPTLVINGSSDVIVYTVNSLTLQQHLPMRNSSYIRIPTTGRSISIPRCSLLT